MAVNLNGWPLGQCLNGQLACRCSLLLLLQCTLAIAPCAPAAVRCWPAWPPAPGWWSLHRRCRARRRCALAGGDTPSRRCRQWPAGRDGGRRRNPPPLPAAGIPHAATPLGFEGERNGEFFFTCNGEMGTESREERRASAGVGLVPREGEARRALGRPGGEEVGWGRRKEPLGFV